MSRHRHRCGPVGGRIDYIQIDHTTKCIEISDYTGSYVDPLTGSLSTDHMTKTRFYLEAFQQQNAAK